VGFSIGSLTDIVYDPILGKLRSADGTGGGGGITLPIDSTDVTFDAGTLTDLEATNVEEAIIELDGRIDDLELGIAPHNNLSGIQGGTTNEYFHLTLLQHNTLTTGLNADALHFHDSENITFNVGSTLTNLTSNDVESAILEVETLINNQLPSTGSEFPSTPYDGQFHWDDEDEVLYFYRSTVEAWIDISSDSLFAVANILYDQTIDGGASTGDPVYFDGTTWLLATGSTDRPTGIVSAIPNAINTGGQATGLSSIVAGTDYWLASAGGVTTDKSETGIFIGIGLSTIALLVDIDNTTGLQSVDSADVTFDGGTLTNLISSNVEDAIIELEGLIASEVDTHNLLIGLQGGASEQYYHLSLSQYTEVTDFFGATDITGAQAETLTDGSNADSLHVHDSSAVTFDGGTLTSLVSSNVEDVVIELEGLIGSIVIPVAGDFNHNDLANIQGGSASERYHLTLAQHNC
jgi:hypothetical protein